MLSYNTRHEAIQRNARTPSCLRDGVPDTYCTGGWVYFRVCLEAVEKRTICYSQSNPNSSVVQPAALSLYSLSCPVSPFQVIGKENTNEQVHNHGVWTLFTCGRQRTLLDLNSMTFSSRAGCFFKLKIKPSTLKSSFHT